METPLDPVRDELRRRVHRFGRAYMAMAIIGGVLIGWLSSPGYGLFIGAVVFAAGLYTYFAFLPFAGWLVRREQSRRNAQ